MPAPRAPVTSLPAWDALLSHREATAGMNLRSFFRENPARAQNMTVQSAGLFLDYSKNRVTEQTVSLLLSLAEQRGLKDRIESMFRGEKINVTENRAALHVALRAAPSDSFKVDGEDVVQKVQEV